MYIFIQQWGVGLRFCISNKLPGDTDPTVTLCSPHF